jgi:hypothetical protein
MEQAAGTIRDWHDFYMLVGTASATLVGLTFVAITIAANALTRQSEAGVQAFITPTVVHFAAILVACLFILAPFGTEIMLGAALLAEGVIGIAYSAWVARLMHRQGFAASLVYSDRVWYAMAPAAGYLILSGAAGAMLAEAKASLMLLACALGLLLVAGIRNAWDMAVWISLRPPSKSE